MFTFNRNKATYRLFTAIIALLFIFQPLFSITLRAQEATEPPLTEAPVVEETLIETGDASAISETESTVNTAVVDTDGEDGEVASTTEPSLGLLASTTNSGTVTNTATTTADTGENSISDVETATIITGDSYAVANVVNLVNTNILNSDGLIQFFTALGLSTLDVRNLFSVFDTSTALSTTPCAVDVCGDNGVVHSTSNNTATINNTVIVRANTGLNTIDGSGSGSITTGDAYAAANIFNLANTNITDSNYLLVSINNLGDLDGDIVLPTSSLLSQLFKNIGLGGNSAVQNNNTATIENNLTTDAATGDNEAAGGTIETGNAVTSANVTNTVNQNLVGGNSFMILLRVHGNWSGDIFGLPNNMLWSESGNGVTIYNNPEQAGGSNSTGDMTVQNNNQANINNNISVFALTGENKIGADGASSISTGNAYASASVTNLANLNILSQNWALLIFDIFGDWGGNITFGRPDLWVGVKATSDDARIMPGSEVKYTFTVSNLGDTPATNVSLQNSFDTAALRFAGAAKEEFNEGKTKASWNLGTIAAGATKEVTYTAKVSDAMPRRTKAMIPLTVEVSARETEDVKDNNTDTIAIESGITRSGGSSNSVEKADLVVTKKVQVANTTVPALVDYVVDIENVGGPLYNAVLSDTLKDSAGGLVYEGYWELGKIAAGEKITVSYAIDFASSTKAGTYTNTAQVTGNHRSSKVTATNQYVSQTASALLNVIEGQVLGVATCSQYLSSHLRFGQDNDTQEVTKLQSFLAKQLGIGLITSGIFDTPTLDAVKNFQEQHKDEILTPWGIEAPTGFVYLTTRKVINEIQCERSTLFPLTQTEEQVIAQSRQTNSLMGR